MNRQTFIKTIAKPAIELHKAGSCLPSLTVAQGCCESAYGTSAPGNMVFGAKWFQGCGYDFQLLKTEEYYTRNEYDALVKSKAWYEFIGVEKGMYHVRIKDKFKKYKSVADSIKDHAKILQYPRYKPVLAAKNYKDACTQIRLCGYATDINYTKTLIWIIEAYGLNKYDAM
jgi:flagellum-specific peptidoglycan hydrolase FlgJ